MSRQPDLCASCNAAPAVHLGDVCRACLCIVSPGLTLEQAHDLASRAAVARDMARDGHHVDPASLSRVELEVEQ